MKINLLHSPYDGQKIEEWKKTTEKLIAQHPLKPEEIVAAVKRAWNAIINGDLCGYKIGRDIFPSPQVIGSLFHELIPLMIVEGVGKDWRRDEGKNEKDLVYIPDDVYSIEIKTSTNKNKIFGNRSYGQKQFKDDVKTKRGYYIAVNYEKITKNTKSPIIYKIRFGWIDYEDWKSQSASTGQQATLPPEVEQNKLITLWSAT